MLSLTQLMASPGGPDFLQSRGVFTRKEDFVVRLQRPFCPDLADSLNVPGQKLVYSHQQVYLDYRRSVRAKIALLAALSSVPDLFPFFLWIDTDRSESDKLSTRIYWPLHGKRHAIKLAPPRTKDIESRFVRLDPAILAQGIERLEAYLVQMERYKQTIQPRYTALQPLFVESPPDLLSQFNRRLTDFLLEQYHGYTPYPMLLSGLANRGFLTHAIEQFVNHLPAVIEVYNKSIDKLRQEQIDVPIRPLPPDYFPLHYTCPVDLKRIRLRHETTADGHFATASCRCGHSESFFLGHKSLSIAAITQTKRWSPDVCVPIFMNDQVSGFVAGRSSALYGLVMNDVLQQVLGKEPVPILVPHHAPPDGSAASEYDSLLYDYLTADQS